MHAFVFLPVCRHGFRSDMDHLLTPTPTPPRRLPSDIRRLRRSGIARHGKEADRSFVLPFKACDNRNAGALWEKHINNYH
jgi:hypothetical protein